MKRYNRGLAVVRQALDLRESSERLRRKRDNSLKGKWNSEIAVLPSIFINQGSAEVCYSPASQEMSLNTRVLPER